MTEPLLRITRAVAVPIAEVRRLQGEGLTQAEMARLWRVSDSALCQALKRVGLSRGRRGPRAAVPTQHELIARMDAAGLSGAEIARVLGVSRQRVNQLMSERELS